jgi:hypothetical protein
MGKEEYQMIVVTSANIAVIVKAKREVSLIKNNYSTILYLFSIIFKSN